MNWGVNPAAHSSMCALTPNMRVSAYGLLGVAVLTVISEKLLDRHNPFGTNLGEQKFVW